MLRAIGGVFIGPSAIAISTCNHSGPLSFLIIKEAYTSTRALGENYVRALAAAHQS